MVLLRKSKGDHLGRKLPMVQYKQACLAEKLGIGPLKLVLVHQGILALKFTVFQWVIVENSHFQWKNTIKCTKFDWNTL